MRVWHDLGVENPELPSLDQMVWLHNDQHIVQLARLNRDAPQNVWTNAEGDVVFHNAMAWTPIEDRPNPPKFRRIWEAT